MNKYLLDTHIIIWFLSNNKRINSSIENNIRYFQYDCYVSMEALREIVTLQELGNKIDLKLNIELIIKELKLYNIKILPIEIKHLIVFEKFPFYKDRGFYLIENK